MDELCLRRKKSLRKEKVAQDNFRGGRFLPFNFRHFFDPLNVIIWTSSPNGKLFKIKFSSQVALNHAIIMDGLRATD